MGRKLSDSAEGPLSPDLFLLSVLPPQSANLLPGPCLQTLLGSPDSPMAESFPRSVQVRWPPGSDPTKVQAHQQLVLVPFMEECRLCTTLRSASWAGEAVSRALDA